jgi:hypothetical protein
MEEKGGETRESKSQRGLPTLTPHQPPLPFRQAVEGPTPWGPKHEFCRKLRHPEERAYLFFHLACHWGWALLGGKLMSALGQKQTSRHVRVMSVIPLKADIHQRGLHVRLVPKANLAS